MNVIFHTSTAICVAVLFIDTKRIENSNKTKTIVWTSVATFLIGLLSHGILDFTPHCYPINSKLDAILGLLMIVFTVWKTNKKYRIIMMSAFIGSILPDIIDLSPSILNKTIGLELPIFDKIFPWHFKEFSGSIYNGNCNASTLYHLLLIIIIVIIIWIRKEILKAIFRI